jgi:2-keto-myo-inositol isomerase
MISRRTMMFSPMVLMAGRTLLASAPGRLAAAGRPEARGRAAAPGKMTLAMHQQTSAGAGFRRSLEGWSRAGIKDVELTAASLDEFLKTDSLPSARRVVADLGLDAVSSACGVFGLWEPGPTRAAAVENFKKRCETFAALGLARIYSPSAATAKFTEDDYKTGIDNMREVGEIAKQFNMTAMIEATRASTFVAALPTMLRMTRGAGNVLPLLDCYHFWSGPSKLEDLDQIRPGEIGHVHFQDTPDLPRELLSQTSRVIPGDGVAPLVRILRTLADKGYAGPLSVELFLPKFTQGDPFEVATEIRRKSEGVMRTAGVL